MAFHSFSFFLFLPIVVALYYLLPFKSRRLMLLAASYYFYMCFKPEYVILLLAFTAVDYFIAAAIQKNSLQKKRKFLLITGLTFNVGMLFLFKYFNLFNDALRDLFTHFNILYQFKGLLWLLPVGISYFTFKKISYLVDVYRENQKAERDFITFALYVSFFPQVMAGPIDRAAKLIPQLYRNVIFDYRGVTEGLKLMAWGFFK
ncbi:MAG: MBOAT family protein, partial [bacterium]|nr:MBOAT family protein [bacterium]